MDLGMKYSETCRQRWRVEPKSWWRIGFGSATLECTEFYV